MTLFWFRTHSPVIASVALASFLWGTLLPVAAAAAPSLDGHPYAAHAPTGAANDALLNASNSGAVTSSTQASVFKSPDLTQHTPSQPPPQSAATFGKSEVFSNPSASSSSSSLSSVSGSAEASSPGPGVADSGAAAAESSASVSPQTISLPDGAGSVEGMGESFTAQLTTGIASMSLPITLPKARGAAQPSLGLSYSSAGGAGIAGVGWSIGAPAVARQTDRGAPKYDDRADWHPEQDRFTAGGSELVPVCAVVGGACSGAIAGEVMPAWAEGWQYFRQRVESNFSRYFWSPDHRTWRVQTKEGLNLEFGVPLDGSNYTGGLQTDPSRPSAIYSWSLAREYDSHGNVNSTAVAPQPRNVVVYRYLQDGGNAYLSDVYDTRATTASVTGVDTSLFAHHARLIYDDRPDASTSYRSGWAIETRKRLVQIDVTSNRFDDTPGTARELLRRYYLSYDTSAHTSYLTALQIEGRCGTLRESADGTLAASACPRLPATELEYQHLAGDTSAPQDSAGLKYEPLSSKIATLDNSPPFSLGNSNVALLDVNSDALPDVVVTDPARFKGGHGLFLNGAVGANRGFAGSQVMSLTGSTDVLAADVRLANPNLNVLDADGDGAADLVHMPWRGRYSTFSAVASGSGWSWAGRGINLAPDQSPKIDFARDADRVVHADVNGDGLVDIIYVGVNELQTFFALGRYPGGDNRFGSAVSTGPKTATLSNEPVRGCLPWSATPLSLGDRSWSFSDMNGDGLTDVVRLRSGQVMYWPGRGNGSFGTGSSVTWSQFGGQGDKNTTCPDGFLADHQVTMTDAPQLGTGSVSALLVDANADGLADVVRVLPNSLEVYLNENGRAFTEQTRITFDDLMPTDNVRTADINGSGTPDIVWGDAFGYRYLDFANGVQRGMLSNLHNGLGKTVHLDYAMSTDLMLNAQRAGQPWRRTAPMPLPVVIRSTTLDHLEVIGRPAGKYVTEYGYRDPYFDGLQREFKGFEVAESRKIASDGASGAVSRSTFLLGTCPQGAPASAPDVCAPANRWQDNWQEGLKGVPALVELYDSTGVYVSSTHYGVKLQQLYAGRDGRRAMAALPISKEVYTYDTSTFDAQETVQQLDEIAVVLPEASWTSTRAVTRRATTGTVKLKTTTTYDQFGNASDQVEAGCSEGCTPVDEVITHHVDFGRPSGDGSGWLWRELSGYITGNVDTVHRNELKNQYNAAGDLLVEQAVLGGTLALDRAVAAPPPDASGGVGTPTTITLRTHTVDVFGNRTKVVGPVHECRAFVYDTQFSQLSTQETAYAGSLGADGCGTTALTTQVSYDRGLAMVASGRDVTNQPFEYTYDAFGRLAATRVADPANPGSLATAFRDTYSYSLPTDFRTRPVSWIIHDTQDGATPNVASYRTSYLLQDGLGEKLVMFAQADAAAGDGGNWIVSGLLEYDGKGLVTKKYENWFTNSAPTSFPLVVPALRYSLRTYDNFERPLQAYNTDGTLASSAKYHALSVDRYDAANMVSGGARNGAFETVVTDGHGRARQSIERFHVGSAIEQKVTVRDYLASNRLYRVTLRHTGSTDVVRWLRYDTLGRVVLNAEPNTSKNFNPNPTTDPSLIKAIRYAYDDAGRLVGTSDARGCGENLLYDTAGRPVVEDYVPCLGQQGTYSAANATTGAGAEVLYRYDTPDSEAASIIDGAGNQLQNTTSLLKGRLVSTSDTASKTVFQYDALGRKTGVATRVTKPGASRQAFATRYAPRWYIKKSVLDAAARVTTLGTGVTVSQLLQGGTSNVTFQYSKRGVVKSVGSSYGLLVAQNKFDANGTLAQVTLGDGASTQRVFGRDDQFRLRSVQTFRATPALWSTPPYPPAPAGSRTQQLSLEDLAFDYDEVGNIKKVTDFRASATASPDWPNTAQPVTRSFEYDDLYRLTKTTYTYPTGGDTWASPYAAENAGSTGLKPSPLVSFTTRVKQQSLSYDFLGNSTSSSDDVSGFYDRSLGTITNGTATAGPNQLKVASNRSTGSSRKCDLVAGYDDAGNLIDLIVKRDGACLPSTASCWQRFRYDWDELGLLAVARRWDLSTAERTANGTLASAVPGRSANVELRYLYDAKRDRGLKTAVDTAGVQSHTVYVFSGLQLRSSAYNGTDYLYDSTTAQVLLPAGETTGRVLYTTTFRPASTMSALRVFLTLSDHLQSTSLVIDRETGELVEAVDYQSYGATNSDYRPTRWGSFREPVRFSGKEEDIEVGLSYFGKRYYSANLNRWLSPDPLEIHQLSGTLNPYLYADGRPISVEDRDGMFVVMALVIAVVVSALIAGATSTAVELVQHRDFGKWSTWGAILTSMGIGAIAGATGFGAAFGGMVAAEGVGLSGWGATLAASMVGGAAQGAAKAALTDAAAGRSSSLGVGGDVAIGAGMGLGTAAVGFGMSAATNALGITKGALGSGDVSLDEGMNAFKNQSNMDFFASQQKSGPGFDVYGGCAMDSCSATYIVPGTTQETWYEVNIYSPDPVTSVSLKGAALQAGGSALSQVLIHAVNNAWGQSASSQSTTKGVYVVEASMALLCAAGLVSLQVDATSTQNYWGESAVVGGGSGFLLLYGITNPSTGPATERVKEVTQDLH